MSEQAASRATEPARWLIDSAAEGVPLTQTHALARSVVREAVERWPHWWDSEVHGPPYREAEVRVLEMLHGGLRRLRLVRRRGRRLLSTPRGRELSQDPEHLLRMLVGDLGAGDEFGEVVGSALVELLAGGGARDWDELAEAAAAGAREDGWRDTEGRAPRASDLQWYVSEVICRGEGYGLVERRQAADHAWHTTIALTEAGRQVFGTPSRRADGGTALVFAAELQSADGVGAQLAVEESQHLTALHDAIQEAFGWLDDHLYSFWLDGRFWGSREHEYTSPDLPDEAPATADVPISELGLKPGAAIAYVFDFGDEWRVLLRLRGSVESDGGPYPRVIKRVGTAPPQYSELGEPS